MAKNIKHGNVTLLANIYPQDEDREPRPPDFRGKMDFAGKTYQLSLWVNKEINGFPVHMSGQITERKDE